jgi:hypothetical protein
MAWQKLGAIDPLVYAINLFDPTGGNYLTIRIAIKGGSDPASLGVPLSNLETVYPGAIILSIALESSSPDNGNFNRGLKKSHHK